MGKVTQLFQQPTNLIPVKKPFKKYLDQMEKEIDSLNNELPFPDYLVKTLSLESLMIEALLDIAGLELDKTNDLIFVYRKGREDEEILLDNELYEVGQISIVNPKTIDVYYIVSNGNSEWLVYENKAEGKEEHVS